MAKVAKLEGVTVWVEIDGKRFGVTPEATEKQQPAFDKRPLDFDTLKQWQAWENLERAREKLATLESQKLLTKNQQRERSPSDAPSRLRLS